MTFYPKLFVGRFKGEIRFPKKSDHRLKNQFNNKAFNSLYCLLAFNSGKLEVAESMIKAISAENLSSERYFH
ncbi:hypothetical protein DSL64_17820 [Dyadobacter luteus]|uniref:Uncharacterized protein n=1 Tax=Dyadobacter luteus TaxID=2259619 RepID=A0A3D8Y8G8_9BACT|nr:hypothetical protein DSL64_17820 [Dyadobacter luteus]